MGLVGGWVDGEVGRIGEEGGWEGEKDGEGRGREGKPGEYIVMGGL